MGNILIGFPNRIDAADLSGGSWVASLPLVNLKERQLSLAARSVDLSPSSTTFTIDFGRKRPLRILAFIAHNFSLSGRYRIEASDAADFSSFVFVKTYDAWGTLAGATWDINSLDWLSNNFWLGTYTPEDIQGQTRVSFQIFPTNILARYWRVKVMDTSNAAGFVQCGRLFTSDIFLQPRINYAYGASLSYEDATGVDTAIGGAEFFDEREPIRVMRFSLSHLDEVEGFTKALELTRRAGVSKEVFVVADPDDRTFGSQRNFLGRLRTLSALEQTMFQMTSMGFEIKEIR